jgi:hypothetical protein
LNSVIAEKQYQLTKWAAIIKSCKESKLKVKDWLVENNISKDQYYYWKRKLKDACLENLQPEFIELSISEELPAPELPVSNPHNNIPASTSTNPSATVHINGLIVDIYDSASFEFIRNITGALYHVK